MVEQQDATQEAVNSVVKELTADRIDGVKEHEAQEEHRRHGKIDQPEVMVENEIETGFRSDLIEFANRRAYAWNDG